MFCLALFALALVLSEQREREGLRGLSLMWLVAAAALLVLAAA